MKISDMINFSFGDDYVETEGCKVYFLRFYPPNLSIMTKPEKLVEITKFKEFYDSLIDQRFQVISLDKTENLSDNKAYWMSLLTDDENDPCKVIRQTIINQIGSIESTSSSVGRAFYFVLKVKDPAELTRFESALSSKAIPYVMAKKQELVTVLRNFNLREFVSFDLYDFEKEVEAAYENGRTKKKA